MLRIGQKSATTGRSQPGIPQDDYLKKFQIKHFFAQIFNWKNIKMRGNDLALGTFSNK